MLHLARVDQLLHRARHVLDRHLRVDPMLVEQVDGVGLEPPQRGVGDLLDVLRPAVETGLLAVASILKPNFVAMTRVRETARSASPTSSSLVNGP